MPSDLAFFDSVQPVVRAPVGALSGYEKLFGGQFAQCFVNVCRGGQDSLLQQPPLGDSFRRVLGLGMLNQIGQYLICDWSIKSNHTLLVSTQYANLFLRSFTRGPHI